MYKFFYFLFFLFFLGFFKTLQAAQISAQISQAHHISDALAAMGDFNPLTPPNPKSPWSGTNIGAGGVFNTGNTQSQNINTAANLIYKSLSSPWQWTSNDTFNFARTYGKGVTASKLFLQSQWQYNFAQKKYSFLEMDYTDDRFDGYDYILNTIVGYGLRVVDLPVFSWDIQGGPGYQRAVKAPVGNMGEDNENNMLLNASTQMNWVMSSNASLSESLGVTSTRINTRTISTTALTANLVKRFAMQLSFQAIYDSLPLSGKKPFNTITTVSLVYTLA